MYQGLCSDIKEVCNFGNNLNDTLRHRFVCGLREETTQRKLLSTVDLTFTKAIEIATAMETGDQGRRRTSVVGSYRKCTPDC